MSNPPADLSAFRTEVRKKTGLAANAVGIVGDGAHQRTGGYHEGEDVLRSIGRYHDPATAHVGDPGEDYSARLLRDRQGLDNDASALDLGDAWTAAAGGRAAWLRYNGLLYAEMRDHPERLPALRAINVSLDGTSKRRYDQQHRADGLISSTDTVTSHTHHEYYRDTEGQPARAQTLARQLELIDAAITGAAGQTGDGDLDTTQSRKLDDIHYTLTTNDQGLGAEHIRWATALPLLQAIAAKVDVDPAELDAIKAAAREGALSAAAGLVAAVLDALPEGDRITKAEVEDAVRAAFARGLAPAE